MEIIYKMRIINPT